MRPSLAMRNFLMGMSLLIPACYVHGPRSSTAAVPLPRSSSNPKAEPVRGGRFKSDKFPNAPAGLLDAATTTTELVSTVNPSSFGKSLTFTATVTTQGTDTPTGTVTFLDGTSQIAQVALDANGQASLATSALAVGSHAVTAQFSGDANFAASAGTLTQVVNAPPTPVSIAVTPTDQVLMLGGKAQQFVATGSYNDGSSLDLTSSANWTSSNPGTATIDPSGIASPVAAGNTGISARYNGVSSPPATLAVKKAGPFVQFLGGGSSAMFLELGQAAQSSAVTGTPCVWTHSSDLNVVARDNRPTAFPPNLPIDESGDIWITWGPGTGTCDAPDGDFDIYAYSSLDSVLGVKCFFAVDQSAAGCIQIFNVPAGTEGENKLCNVSGPCVFGPDSPIPHSVIAALHGKRWFAAGTDILPEDAKFAVLRMFTPCGETIWRQPFDQGLRQTYGLGYNGAIPGIGMKVNSHFSDSGFHTLDFNISGNDPLNTAAGVPAYTISPVGAKPIIVAVSPADSAGIGAATDITAFTLALFTEGILGRSTDLIGPAVPAPITTLISEPLSGPYNVMEYSIPNSSEFHTSQDENNCDGQGGVYSNAMDLQSNNGNLPAFRVRAVGTSEMIRQLQAATSADQRLGYFYWSAANASKFTSANGKYLTVNGVDPLQDHYSDGVLPGADSTHPLSNVSFKWLNMGDYPIWSVLRLVSTSPTPVGVTNLISAAQTLNASQHNFIPLADLKVWHSHYYLPATGSGVSALGYTINAANDLCPAPGALPEMGGDLGGANVLKQVNYDFCMDFQNPNGLINKAN